MILGGEMEDAGEAIKILQKPGVGSAGFRK